MDSINELRMFLQTMTIELRKSTELHNAASVPKRPNTGW